MRDQPSVKAQEAEITTNKTSVPTGGKELFLAPADTAELVRDRLTAGLDVHNPAARSPESINRGKAVYDVYCAPCHGTQGHGDGPVGLKFTPPPMDLTLELYSDPAGWSASLHYFPRQHRDAVLSGRHPGDGSLACGQLHQGGTGSK